MKIVCLGDSLTYGYGVRRKDVWTKVASDISGNEYINKGVNGDTTGGMLSRFNEDVRKEKPRAVFLMGGTNDFIMDEPVSRVKANISSMAYQALSEGITPIIGIETEIIEDMIDVDWRNFADFKAVKEKSRQYGEWVKRYSKTFGIDYIDAFGMLKEKSKVKYSDLYLDGLHLSIEGNRLMAEIVSGMMDKFLRR